MPRDSEDAIIIYTPEGKIIEWNNGAVTPYGFSRKQACTMNIFDIIPDGHKENMREKIVLCKKMELAHTIREMERVHLRFGHHF